MRNQHGVAAIEMALCSTMLVALAALAGPAISGLLQQVRMGNTAGSAAQFAAQVPDHRRSSCEGSRLDRRSPTANDVIAEARCAHFGEPGSLPTGFEVDVSPDPAAPSTGPGTTITVTVRNSVDLGPLASLFGRGPTVVLTSTAEATKE